MLRKGPLKVFKIILKNRLKSFSIISNSDKSKQIAEREKMRILSGDNEELSIDKDLLLNNPDETSIFDQEHLLNAMPDNEYLPNCEEMQDMDLMPDKLNMKTKVDDYFRTHKMNFKSKIS